jgi:peptidoglycan/xylan/chitin deacetylase (PgdA/CDA1 family)
MGTRNSINSRSGLPLQAEKRLVLIVTHDVDWPRKGPGTPHILARSNRFDAEIMRRVANDGFNPYYGIPVVAEIEERLGIRSTFFFRPKYDDGSTVQEYEDTIKELGKDGWEVGLHVNDPSTVVQINSEKESIERIATTPVYGSRIHYLKVADQSFLNLAEAGLKYDSSLMYSKDKIDSRNSGYLLKNGLCVFPITFMDTYLFTYMGLTDKTVTRFVIKATDSLYSSGVQIITLLWHDSSIMMKGGRAYSDMMNQLAARPNTVSLRAIDAFELVHKQRFEWT